MLAADEPVRVFHNEVKQRYALYDFVIVGIVNEENAHGVFNPDTLNRIYDLTGELLTLRRGAEGLPEVTRPGRADRAAETRTVDLRPDSLWRRLLNIAFRHEPNNLFTQNGESAIIAREIISPSVVDNLRQAELGALKIEYLMESPPSDQAEADRIRADALSNPLYRDTLAAADGKAIALYIPIQKKSYSYTVAELVRRLTAGWPEADHVYITGLPVAEDTFGVEMLVQMATSAPMAGVAIFLLLLLFFRRLSLIIAPMVLAVVTILCTMGLLIGMGFDVHIMSSMIAIFLMPISVADSVHILSEFFDVYPRFQDKRKTVRHVIGHLFTPMLYTSLTTVAGFASLATTPIPPVKVFGLFVASGVALAWVLTMTLIPAFIILFVPQRSLDNLRHVEQAANAEVVASPWLNRILEWLGRFTYIQWKAILAVTVLVLGVSAYGISRINVNDNPVKWFTESHPIRVADRVLNAHFGGTYTAYLTLAPTKPDAVDCREKAQFIAEQARRRLAPVYPDATREFLAEFDKLKQRLCSVFTCDPRECFVELVSLAEKIDRHAADPWNRLADEVNYLDPEGLTRAGMTTSLTKTFGADFAPLKRLLDELKTSPDLAGAELQSRALDICDRYTRTSFRRFVMEMEAEVTAPPFKRPEMLRYVESLQKYMESIGVVGKTSSAVDALKKAAYELMLVQPPADASPEERARYRERNEANFAVPDSAAAAGQVFTQLEGMKKKDSLFHLVTRDYDEANIWVQLKSGDNQAMEHVVTHVRTFMAENPPPIPVKARWAGLTYINVVWQDKMVVGMLSALGSSAVVVFVMMLVLFRSPLLGLLSMIPLTVTISFTYGLIGLLGKDYDMPVAVLSSLTLGLSVDFAIHFIERARELQRQLGSWKAASTQMFKEPAMAISRNAITISVGFLPLLLAPLVPYRTVGFFLASIMVVSWVATLFILPALITMLKDVLFKQTADGAVTTDTTSPQQGEADHENA
jgi:predicted RND superfamily exporter protein